MAVTTANTHGKFDYFYFPYLVKVIIGQSWAVFFIISTNFDTTL